MAAISDCVSLAAPFSVWHHETRIMFNRVNTELRLEVFRVACCCYFTKESELLSTSVSLYSTGSYPGQWVIWVSGTDPVSTLVQIIHE